MGCANKLGDSVVDVDHEAARRQVSQGHRITQVTSGAGRAVAPPFHGAEQLGVAVNRHCRFVVRRLGLPAATQRPGQHLNPVGARANAQAVFQRCRDPGLLQNLDQSRRVLRHGYHCTALCDPLRDVPGEIVQTRALIGQRLQNSRRVLGAPTLHAHGGCAGGVHLFGHPAPLGGGRRKTVGEFPTVLAAGPLLLVLGLLLLRFPGQTVGPVHHNDGVSRKVIGQGMPVEEPVVERKGFRVGFGQQMRQFFLKPRDRPTVARAQIYPGPSFVEPCGVAQLGQLLPRRHDADTVGIAH